MKISGIGMTGLTMVAGCAMVLAVGAPIAEGQEIDPNDFRVSYMGGSGTIVGYGERPRVACRDSVDECLVVWHGTDGSSDQQIFGQRFDGDTANPLGPRISISAMSSWAGDVNVTYIPSSDRFMVVWSGGHDVGGGQLENEVFGQLINATNGDEVGVDDFRISYFGPAGDNGYWTSNPSGAYNPSHNELLVAWMGTSPAGEEVWVQRLNAATGAAIGANLLISEDAAPVSLFGPNGLSVVHDAEHDEYLVVWTGKIDSQQTGIEVFGQRLDGATAAEIGLDDFRISYTGIDGVAVGDHVVWGADVAYAPGPGRYIVVWGAQDDPEPQMALESEIYMQAIAGGTGVQVGGTTRLSDVGGLGAVAFQVSGAMVECDHGNTCLVVLSADETGYGGLVDGEWEVFGQLINAETLSEVGANDFRMSDLGPNGDPAYGAYYPAVTFIPGLSRYMTVWWGDTYDLFPVPLVDGEYEIWGQLVEGGLIFSDGFEEGDTSGWSD